MPWVREERKPVIAEEKSYQEVSRHGCLLAVPEFNHVPQNVHWVAREAGVKVPPCLRNPKVTSHQSTWRQGLANPKVTPGVGQRPSQQEGDRAAERTERLMAQPHELTCGTQDLVSASSDQCSLLSQGQLSLGLLHCRDLLTQGTR